MIDFAGIPFFDIDHDRVSHRKKYVIAAAGLWVQGLSAEWLLSRDPDLRHGDLPFRKGLFAFHIATSLMYAAAGLGRIGPVERDTYGMAVSVGEDGIPEPVIGVLVLAPAVLDGYRYFHAKSHWAAWASRVTKLATVALTIAAR